MRLQIRVRPNPAQLAERFDGDIMEGFNWGELVPIVADAVERIFRTEGGGNWPPLNPQYAAWKARNYPGAGILVRTGEYFRAATTPGGAFNVIEITDNGLTYGVEGLSYPQYHESESPKPPQRPVFALLETDAELRQTTVDALSEFIAEKLGGR